ncbi:MAG: hypothetical protein HFACDABA_01586 [Anaerolineales bacterium]|nr:hypothetical protein [Anaerolineales bacterium]
MFRRFAALFSRALLHNTLFLLLIIGLLQGLCYVFLIPPWRHYDEPGHFEFAWQVAHFDHWPQKGEVNEPMRRKLAASLIRHGWYDLVGFQPDLKSGAPIEIPYAPQTSSAPLYYLVASIPLRVLGSVDFAIQVRILRLVSLGMFLLTLWAAWKTLDELLPKRHPVQWMTVLFLALLPGFADTMTAVNDDVGAALAFSIFTWAGVWILKHGPSWRGILFVLLGAALCYGTKNTAWPALLLTPLVLLFSFLRGRWRWAAWAACALGAAASLFILLRRDDPALWYRATSGAGNIRAATSADSLGEYAFQVRAHSGGSSEIGQFVPVSYLTSLRGKTVTLGAWIWSDRPLEIQLPTLRVTLHSSSGAPSLVTLFDDLDRASRELLGSQTCATCMGEIKTTLQETAAAQSEPWFVSPRQRATPGNAPAFYSVTFTIPLEAESGWVELAPFPADGEAGEAVVYYDGLVMAAGKHNGAPEFDSSSAQAGAWNGKSFANLIRNPSGESTAVRLTPIGENVLGRIFTAGEPSVFVASIQDWSGTRQYYAGMINSLFETFWGRPAANRVDLLGAPRSYESLRWVTFLALIAAFFLAARKFNQLPRAILFFLGMSLVSVWGLTLARGGIEVVKSYGVLPWARYAFPAAVPTALLLCAGWWEFLRVLGGRVHLSARGQAHVFIAFMLSVDLIALMSIARAYYWKNEQDYLFWFAVLFLAAALGIRAADRGPHAPENNGRA